jgi:prepilin-type N-terminal cleavage/methylation domain-containing protein
MKAILKAGFTLVELAIVIVVVAIVIAGVIAGQDLLESSKMQAVTKEFDRYNSYINTFRMRYSALPGDMRRATDYWSSAINGDGDGYMAGTESDDVWEHLTLAELSEKSYDASATSLYEQYPESVISNAFYKVHAAGESGGNWEIGTSTIYEKRGNFLGLGMENGYKEYPGGVMNAKAAKSMDDKIDDGNPSSGKLTSIKGATAASTFEAGCVTSAGISPYFATTNRGDANYDLSNDTKSCRLIYWLK